MPDEPTVTVELTVREARALAFCANLLGEALDGQRVPLPGDPGPIAAETGAMKLETAIVCATGEPCL